jgi:SAM-dependent methyltransferase
MTDQYTTAEVLEVYGNHPLSRATILDRITRQRRANWPIRELDLAVDPAEYITDQNHVGGAAGTLRLASQCALSPDDRVLDLGCGLGGPARLVADIYGCRVRGVDASAARTEDARSLASLVGLSHQVGFDTADILTVTFPREYSVVWAQNSWTHVGDPTRLAVLAAAALAPGGRVAFEDIVLQRAPQNETEQRLLATLGSAWRSTFARFEVWRAAFVDCGFEIRHSADLVEMLVEHLEILTRLSADPASTNPPNEVSGWRTGLALARSGVISYGRIVAATR